MVEPLSVSLGFLPLVFTALFATTFIITWLLGKSFNTHSNLQTGDVRADNSCDDLIAQLSGKTKTWLPLICNMGARAPAAYIFTAGVFSSLITLSIPLWLNVFDTSWHCIIVAGICFVDVSINLFATLANRFYHFCCAYPLPPPLSVITSLISMCYRTHPMYIGSISQRPHWHHYRVCVWLAWL
jgi:hypothetical protein